MASRWSGIVNRERLLDHGPVALRTAAVDILEHGIRAADPYEATLDLVKREGNLLRVGPLQYDLTRWNHVYVVGAGKATQPIAQALEEALGERITAGVVALKRGEAHRLQRIQIIDAAHPVPDEASYRGAQAVVELARRAGERDIVFSLITGGSSALLTWPPEGVTLTDKQVLNEALLGCGASIREINAVRKHVSRIKGGRLALEIFPATLINLTVSDVVGDPLDYITDLTVPDTSTYQDAWHTLDKYDLWAWVPESVREYLKRGAEIETPKAFPFSYHTFMVIASDAACLGAARRSEELGYATQVLTTKMEGESRDQAHDFVASADAFTRVRPRGMRCAILASGETTVTLDGAQGQGGPSQEFALTAALAIGAREHIVVASVDTDGTDGPTDASGGLVDGETVAMARAMGLDAAESLRTHTSRSLLEAAGDLVITGPTGTNVNDLILLLVGC